MRIGLFEYPVRGEPGSKYSIILLIFHLQKKEEEQ